MLLSILPGVREFRTPLAVGATWLAAAYLAIAELIPLSASDTTGTLQAIYVALGAGGAPVVLTVLTFVAYLAGLTLIGISTFVSSVVARILPLVAQKSTADMTGRSPSGSALNEDGLDEIISRRVIRTFVTSSEGWERALVAFARGNRQFDLQHFLHETVGMVPLDYENRQRQMVREMVGVTDGAGGLLIAPAAMLWSEVVARVASNPVVQSSLVLQLIDYEYYARRLKTEVRDLPALLISKERDVFERWDRLASEAEFRTGMAVPASLVLAVAAVQSAGAWAWSATAALAFGAVGAFWSLIASGIERKRRADGQLVECIRSGIVSSPTLEDVASAVVTWRNREVAETMAQDTRALPGSRYLLVTTLDEADTRRIADRIKEGESAKAGESERN